MPVSLENKVLLQKKNFKNCQAMLLAIKEAMKEISLGNGVSLALMTHDRTLILYEPDIVCELIYKQTEEFELYFTLKKEQLNRRCGDTLIEVKRELNGRCGDKVIDLDDFIEGRILGEMFSMVHKWVTLIYMRMLYDAICEKDNEQRQFSDTFSRDPLVNECPYDHFTTQIANYTLVLQRKGEFQFDIDDNEKKFGLATI